MTKWRKVKRRIQAFRGMFKGMAGIDSSEKTTALMEKIDTIVPSIYASFTDSQFHTKMGFRPVLVNGGTICNIIHSEKIH